MNKQPLSTILEMKILGIQTRTTEASFNKIQAMEERIPDIEDMIEEIDILVKENVNSKKLTQNIQEIWGTIKRPNLRIIGIEKGEESQFKEPQKYFQQNHRRKFS